MNIKKSILVVALCLLPLGMVAQDKPVETEIKTEAEVKPDAEKASYAIGVSMGQMILQNLVSTPGGDKLDKSLIIKGFNEMLQGNVSLSAGEVNKTIQEYFDTVTKMENEAIRKAGEDFLAVNAKKKGVKTTNSGLQYKILKEGKGIKPTVEDTVQVHYKGMLLDGTVFDSSYERNEPIKFSPLQVIPGWTEGLCLLRKGSKAELYIPYTLAYGERGAGRKIPPYSMLKFEIELLDVIKGEPIPVSQSIDSTKEETKELEPNAPKK